VSRQPVLQALRLLKKDGFVQDAPGRGLQVAPLDPTGCARSTRCAARSTRWPRGWRPSAATARPALISQGRKAARGDDVMAMIDADLAFHAAIYAAAGNPLIEQSAQLHWRHLRRVMGAVLQQTGQREAVWDEHEAIAGPSPPATAKRAAQLIEEHGRRQRQPGRAAGLRAQDPDAEPPRSRTTQETTMH
jgi:DNA-binding GntR family transcriptional regulator